MLEDFICSSDGCHKSSLIRAAPSGKAGQVWLMKNHAAHQEMAAANRPA
jgi:hypothetical protein